MLYLEKGKNVGGYTKACVSVCGIYVMVYVVGCCSACLLLRAFDRLGLGTGALLSEFVGADLVRVLKFPLLHKGSLADAEEVGHNRGRSEHDASADEQHRSCARGHCAIVYI